MKSFSALRVLVVDDQPIIDEFCRKMLEQLGCAQVLSALNGREAIEILTHKKGINLVLADINMSPGNGLELLQAIRCGDIPGLPRDLCVLMFTDYNYRQNVINAIRLDCNAIISKPISAAILSEKIVEARRRNISPASAESYRRIPTAISTSTGQHQTAASPAKPSAKASARQHPASPPSRLHTQQAEATTEAGPAPALVPTCSDPMQQAIDELTPGCTGNTFLQQRQQQLTTILHQLNRVRHEVALGNNTDALQLTQQVEQITASLFEQEYQHQQAHHYDRISAHQAEHGLILQRTQTLATRIRQHKPSRTLKAHRQLLQAWYRHLTGKDQQYSRFLTAREAHHPRAEESNAETAVIFDHHSLAEQLGGDIKAAARMVQLFADTLSAELNRLQQALDGNDLVTAGPLSHRLKGSARTCGCSQLAEYLQQIETACCRADQPAAHFTQQQIM